MKHPVNHKSLATKTTNEPNTGCSRPAKKYAWPMKHPINHKSSATTTVNGPKLQGVQDPF